MTTRRIRRRAPFAPTQMFDLVADVERYPAFLPWCNTLRVINRSVVDGVEVATADMGVAFGPFRETFRSRSHMRRDALAIDTAFVSGPLKRLASKWRFEPADGGSTIDYALEFEFRNPLLARAAGFALERAFIRMADAFLARAREIYADD